MQYILNETEYQAFLNLKEENAKLSHKLAVASKAREMGILQINSLSALVAQSEQAIKERDQCIVDLEHVRDLNNKKLAAQAHELLCKEAELANLSSQVQSLVKENQTYCNQIAEMKRDCEGSAKALADARTNVYIVQHPVTDELRLVGDAALADSYHVKGWAVSGPHSIDSPA